MSATLAVQHSDGGGVITLDPADVAGTRANPTSSDPVTSYLLGLRAERVGTSLYVNGLTSGLDALFASRAGDVVGEAVKHSGLVTDVAEKQIPLAVGQRVFNVARTL